MATYTVINGTQNALSNINAGSDDVPAFSTLDSVLDGTELAALLTTAGVAVVKSTTSRAAKREIRKVLNVGHKPGVSGRTGDVPTASPGNPSGVLHYGDE